MVEVHRRSESDRDGLRWCDCVDSSPASNQRRTSDQWRTTTEWRHRLLPVLQQTRPTRRQGNRDIFLIRTRYHYM